MKKTIIALTVALAATGAVQAAFQDETVYVGGKLAWSRFFKTDASEKLHSAKVNQMGGGAFVGYQFNPYLATEMGYDWLGNARYYSEENVETGKMTSQGVQISAKGSYPIRFISDNLDIYARAGGMLSTTKAKHMFGRHDTVTKVGLSPLVAVGFDYKIFNNVATRIEYQYTNHMKSSVLDPNVRLDNTLFSLGLMYGFGQTQKPAPAPIIETQPMTVDLSSDFLFDFDKSTLKPGAQEILSNLATQINQADPNHTEVIVNAFTDRLGSAAYNLRLSQQRADAIKNFLINQGVAANIITAKGLGKDHPVTGSTCNNIKPKKALAACLAPDRRASINVQPK